MLKTKAFIREVLETATKNMVVEERDLKNADVEEFLDLVYESYVKEIGQVFIDRMCELDGTEIAELVLAKLKQRLN